ncbi:MAG: hypothetical protein JW829_11695 [Pirellulales bacterium]|nr:hypothetical protein [Pirellulales bacterium]
MRARIRANDLSVPAADAMAQKHRYGGMILAGILIGLWAGKSAVQAHARIGSGGEPSTPSPVVQHASSGSDKVDSAEELPGADGQQTAPKRTDDQTPVPTGDSRAPNPPDPAVAEKNIDRDGTDENLPGRTKPDIFLLPDKDGNLQSVLGFQYEDFLEAWQIKQGVSKADHEPLFNLASLSIEGKQTLADVAELSVQVDIIPLKNGPIPVPLRFSDAILMEVERTSSSDGIIYDQQQGGLVAWVHGTAGESIPLKLHLLVKLKQSGNKSQLQLTLPSVEVAVLTLDVPARQVEAQVNRGIIELVSQPNRTTRIIVRGPAGLLDLVWTTTQRPRTHRSSLLQATGAILSMIDDHGIVTEAHLTIQSFGGPIDRCRIRLPAGSRLRTVGEGDLTWEEVPESDTDASSVRGSEYLLGPVYEFKLGEPQSGSIQLDLVTEQPIQMSGATSIRNGSPGSSLPGSTATDLAGFEVLGTLRQFGHIAVRLDENLRLDWESNNSIRQTTSLPKQLQRDDLVAAFEYFRQPWSLPVRILPRPSRVRIHANHLLVVGRNDLLWQGKFKLNVQNAALFALRMNISGWEMEPDGVGPRPIVDAARFVVERDGIVEVPLRQPIEGDVTVTVTARRSLLGVSDRLVVPIPALQQASVTGETLTVVTPGNITLQPDLGASRGLAPIEQPTQVDLPVSLWSPRFLAYRCFLNGPEFVARMVHHERIVRAEADTKVTLQRDRAEVESTITWFVQYAPIDQVSLAIPNDPEVIRTLEARYDGQPITIPLPAMAENRALQESRTGEEERRLEKADGQLKTGDGNPGIENNAQPRKTETSHLSAKQDTGTLRADVRLPHETVGRVTLVLRNKLDWSLLAKMKSGDIPDDFPVPLILPADLPLDRNIVTVLASPESAMNVTMSSRSGTWKSMEVDPNGESDYAFETVLRVQTTQHEKILPLVVNFRPLYESTDCAVDRMWIQTRIGDRSNQTRCLFTIQTRRPTIDITLPRYKQSQIDTILVDGRSTLYEWSTDNHVKILLTPQRTNDPRTSTKDFEPIHRIEIQFHGSEGIGFWKRIQLEPPSFTDGIIPRRIYWQVMMPSYHHLLVSSGTWLREHVWCWQGMVACRQPVLDTRALAHWIRDDATPSVQPGANVYLFSTYSRPVPLTISVISRSMIVFLSSGLSLGIGLLLLYFPRMRQPFLLWIGATVLAAAFMVWTDLTVMVTQGAIFGLFLGLLALFLYRILMVPQRPTGFPLTSGSSASHPADAERLYGKPATLSDSRQSPESAAPLGLSTAHSGSSPSMGSSPPSQCSPSGVPTTPTDSLPATGSHPRI